MVKSTLERDVDDEDKDAFEPLQPPLISEVADNLSTARTAAMNNIDQLRLRLGGESQGVLRAATVVWFAAGWVRETANNTKPSPAILVQIKTHRKEMEVERETFNARAFEFTQARLHRPDQDGRAVAPNHGDASQPPNDVSLHTAQMRPSSGPFCAGVARLEFCAIHRPARTNRMMFSASRNADQDLGSNQPPSGRGGELVRLTRQRSLSSLSEAIRERSHRRRSGGAEPAFPPVATDDPFDGGRGRLPTGGARLLRNRWEPRSLDRGTLAWRDRQGWPGPPDSSQKDRQLHAPNVR